MNLQFSKATKNEQRLRMTINGPAGAGKTFTALTIAQYLGQKVAVIDTENGSSEAYANLFNFDVLKLPNNNPRTYISAVKLAVDKGYDVVIIDSLSHAWNGKGGVLETVDMMNTQTANSGWRNVTPLQNELVDTILRCPIHLIGTMRVKIKHSYEKNDRGRVEPKKLGLAPIQREGFEYEFDIILDMTHQHAGFITKTRCLSLDGYTVMHPGKELAMHLKGWLEDSEPEPDRDSDEWKKKLKHFHALGREIYEDRWDAIRAKGITRISNGLYSSSTQLKDSQIDRMIDGMKTVQKENRKKERQESQDQAGREEEISVLVEAAQVVDEVDFMTT